MKLKSGESQFILSVIGYEFERPSLKEDMNWLNIDIQVEDTQHQWNAQGPYITTFDLKTLFSWFEDIKFRRLNKFKLNFLEHELSFSFNEEHSIISVNLDYAFHPLYKTGQHIASSGEYSLSFDLINIDIDKVLFDLEMNATKYPIR